jgi:galactokinase
MEPFAATAPGRLCLFGEHQDYLNLPVIALALPLACRIEVIPNTTSRDLVLRFGAKVWKIDLDNTPPKQVLGEGGSEELDFALAAVHEVIDDGWIIQCGADCVSTTTIPLQAGCSSSSAFCVAWMQVLSKLSGNALSPLELAQWAHRAEVVHFGSPGGTMDHVTSALGGVLRIGPGMWDYQHLGTPPGVWVLAYSGEPKDTMKHLNRCKGDRLRLLEKLGGSWDKQNNATHNLSEDEALLLQATRTNRATEQRAASKWTTASGSDLGLLMTQHHDVLRDGLLLSTPKLEAMNEAAMKEGAWGFKVVGSGGGGCGVAWCASRDLGKNVASAMEQAGAPNTWIIPEASAGASFC